MVVTLTNAVNQSSNVTLVDVLRDKRKAILQRRREVQVENESTDQFKGNAQVLVWVKPEPRRPAYDYRSSTLAD